MLLSRSWTLHSASGHSAFTSIPRKMGPRSSMALRTAFAPSCCGESAWRMCSDRQSVSRAGRAAHEQLKIQQPVRYGLGPTAAPWRMLDDELRRRPRERRYRLSDRGELRPDHGSDGGIVESRHGELIGQGQA